MKQTTVTDYFKVKKRPREESLSSSTKAKLVAVISSSGKDGPSPIRSNDNSTSNLQTKSPAKFFSPSYQRDIFSSPVKLCEITSPSPNKLLLSPAVRVAVKILFETSTGTESNDSPIANKIPAYQRYHHLTQKTGAEINLAASPSKPVEEGLKTNTPPALEARPSVDLHLPFKFKLLQELFQAVETVTSILYNRKELITFEKVRPAVQQLVRRITLKEKHLGQMLTVFPGCYTLAYEKLQVKTSYQQTGDQLIIGINLSASGLIGESDIMSPVVITERRRIFRSNILKIADGHHRFFLSSLIPPIVIPANKLVRRWHPKFRVDEVPDIDATGVPQQTSEKVNTARDVISRAQSIIENDNTRIKKALQYLLKKRTEDKEKKSVTTAAVKSATPSEVPNEKGNNNTYNTKKSVKALKGISQSLIEKIRARELEKSIRTMTFTPEEAKQKEMVNRLPDFVKMLRNTMVAEKMSALPLNLAVDRLFHSTHGTLSPDEVEENIRLLASKLPMFVNIIRCTQGEYVKIDKTIDINTSLDHLKGIIRKLK